MKREQLMMQVKDEYARLADISSKDNFTDHTATNNNAEEYFETLLQNVLNGIQEGRFDQYSSGKEIVEAVANDKSKLYG